MISDVDRQRATNLWEAFVRKFPPLMKASTFAALPEVGFEAIGGLERAKDEVLTYACAVTDPDVYERWGTFPSPGVLLVGPQSCGKTLLAQALAKHTSMSFVQLAVPRLVLQVLHQPKNIPELLNAWGSTLSEMPSTTVLFEELEFTQQDALGEIRRDLPIGPIMEFLLDLIDRAIEADGIIVVGSTSQPERIRPALLAEGRFERVVEVRPVFPDDIAAALRIHAARAEKRAGRPLFREVDWEEVVRHRREGSIGEWVHLLHAVLRSKARCDAADEPTDAVSTADLISEVELSSRVKTSLPQPSGRYL